MLSVEYGVEYGQTNKTIEQNKKQNSIPGFAKPKFLVMK